MLRLKNIMKRGEEAEVFEKPRQKSRTSNPWLIEQVKNGLKAVNVKILTDSLRITKKIQTQYFENDRIYGTGAYVGESVLKVIDMFDELRAITPNTIGYIYDRRKYLYHNGGILRKDLQTKEEEFFSEKTIRNENVDNFFQLTQETDENEEYETDTTEPDVYSDSTELIQSEGYR